MTSEVRDNADLRRFELEVDGAVAVAKYVRHDNVVTFTHTEVPEALGGRGIGSKLAEGALDMVRARGEKVVAQCPFVASWIARHPAYADLLAASDRDKG
jgi:predicted GNAT family acetyltransferase